MKRFWPIVLIAAAIAAFHVELADVAPSSAATSGSAPYVWHTRQLPGESRGHMFGRVFGETTREEIAAFNYPTPPFGQTLAGVLPAGAGIQSVACSPNGDGTCSLEVTGGTGGGGSSGSVTAAGTNGTSAQAVQGITGGVPIAITGSIAATSTYPYTGSGGQAQSGTPSYLGEGCTYTPSGIAAPTSGYFVPCQSDVFGNEKVVVGASLPSGSATIGAVTNGGGFPTPQPLQTDSGTGALLTKSVASVNGTYGAPNTTVTASATSVQYEQGTGPNGTFNVNLGATPQPVSGTLTANAGTGYPTPLAVQPISGAPTPIAYTSAAPIPATIVNQPASYPITSATTLPVSLATLPPLAAGSATIGSIGNTAFGITGSLPTGANTIGAVNINGTVPVSGTVAISNQLSLTNAGTSATTNVGAIQGVTGGVPVPISGTVSATSTYPYSLTTQGQTALASSGVGVLGVYNATAPTLTTGQAAPLQQTSAGLLEVAGGPYTASGLGQTATANDTSGIGCTYLTTVASATSGQFVPCHADPTGNISVNISGTGSVQPSTSFHPAATGLSFTSQNLLNVVSQTMAYNGTSNDTIRKDTYAAGPAWVTTGGSTTAAFTTTAAIKASAGRLERILVTTAPTVTGVITCYDNASAASGTVIGVVPTAQETAGTIIGPFDMPAANGIYCSSSATGGAFTVSYF